MPGQLSSDFSFLRSVLSQKCLIWNGDFLRDATLWRAPRALLLVPERRSTAGHGSVVDLLAFRPVEALSFDTP